MYDIAIVGGGLSGLISSILLSRNGFKVVLLEKNEYPFHRVCGEYISNEVIPFLEENDLFPAAFSPAKIDKLTISSTNGFSFQTSLDLGGFGISRFVYDQWLASKARDSGVELHEKTMVSAIDQVDNSWEINTSAKTVFKAKMVISAHGKRSKIDQTLNRPFLKEHSPYVGVKYHVKTDYPADMISLHNFKGGYCGFSKVEDDLYNICYLTHRDHLKEAGNIDSLESNVLFRNPHLKELWKNSEFVFDKPEVINEISFKPKALIHNGLLMVGDAAGMITPLAGNGMAMAIRSATILSKVIQSNHTNRSFDLPNIYADYEKQWNAYFKKRLWKGRQIQNIFFGSPISSSVAVITGKLFSNVTRSIIRQTHGEPFSTASAR